jgi:PBP1b-binding outer membrane lipoprotein LpoB
MKRITVGIAIALLIGGCASEPRHLDSKFGSSVSAAIEAQTLNPSAGDNTTPVMSMDGKKAAGNLEAYRRDVQKKTQVQNIINIGN